MEGKQQMSSLTISDPTGARPLKEVKEPSDNALSHMGRPFREGQALKTTLTTMFPFLKSQFDVYCNHYRKIYLTTSYFTEHFQWHPERSVQEWDYYNSLHIAL